MQVSKKTTHSGSTQTCIRTTVEAWLATGMKRNCHGSRYVDLRMSASTRYTHTHTHDDKAANLVQTWKNVLALPSILLLLPEKDNTCI